MQIAINKYAYVLLCPTLAGAFLCANGQAGSTKKPNIIFLLADDMRYDAMGCAGNQIVKTPNLDKLAANGVRFNNAFVTTSVCCCSRVSILTGQYVARHGINDFKTPLTDSAFSLTYPMLMKDAGYQVGFIGKYGIGSNTNGVAEKFDYFWGSAEQPKYENVDKDGNYIHYTDLVESHIKDFFASTSKDKPFCLSVSFKAPHVQDGDPRQFIYNPRYETLFENIYIPEQATNTNEDWERFPDFFKNNNEARIRWKLRFSNPQQYQRSVKGYYRLIYGLDKVVGSIREELKLMGLDQNTIIVFFSDNGFYLGEHGLAGKWYAHEPSIRVPLIVYDPQRNNLAGSTISDMVLNIDIAPTLLSMVDLPIPHSMQGKDISVLLNPSKKKNWRRAFYYEHPMTQFPTIPPSQGLRTERYKYIVYPGTEPLYEELYDLQTDKDETKNLAAISGNERLLDKVKIEFQNQKNSILNKK